MCSYVARESALSDGAVRVLCAIGFNLVGAVVLLVGLAIVARKVGTNLSSNTNSVSNLNVLNLRTDLNGLANNLVAYAKREWMSSFHPPVMV
jgi:hypothetical protein